MKNSSTILIGLGIASLTLGMGIVHGRLTNRWGQRTDLVAAAKQLERTPDVVGNWRAVSKSELNAEIVRELQCAGHVTRVYENARSGDRVTVAVLFGPPGPISVHTPEICYSARDYQITADRQPWKIELSDASMHEFWDLRLKANDVSNSPLRTLYAWTANGIWQATGNPRFEFGGSSYLYKIQLAGPVPNNDEEFDVCRDFLAEFLPVLNKHMIESRK